MPALRCFIGRLDDSYAVHDVYLDAEDLRLFWLLHSYKERQRRNRYQLRLRSYRTSGDAPTFFETKREARECLFKQRAGVHQEFVRQLLAGQTPGENHLLTLTCQELVALQNFWQLVKKLGAEPRLRVCFQREAYSNDDDQLRLTFDREVGAEMIRDDAAQPNSRNRSLCYKGKVILEVKFASYFPEWMRQLVWMQTRAAWEGLSQTMRMLVLLALVAILKAFSL